jgi:hypothetical protein
MRAMSSNLPASYAIILFCLRDRGMFGSNVWVECLYDIYNVQNRGNIHISSCCIQRLVHEAQRYIL